MNRWLARLTPVALLPLLSGCVLDFGAINYAGPIAGTEWHLFIIVASILFFVGMPVWLLVPIVAWRYRLANRNNVRYEARWGFSWWLEGLIWLPPTGIVIGLAVILWIYTHHLDPYRPLSSAQSTVEVQAVSFDWKWLFIYPDQQIATINQLKIPVDRPIHISLTSGTVMQALLIPQLAGQIYAMGGMTTQLNLAARRAGVFRGENVQYNGDGFQNEKFDVVALPQDEYDNWLKQVQGSNHPFEDADYVDLFKKTSPKAPSFYSSAPPGLFKKIVTQVRGKAQ